MSEAAAAATNTGFCQSIGHCATSTFETIGDYASSAARWTVATLSSCAEKVKEFVMNTVWPALQQFWAWLSNLCSSAKDLASQNPREFTAFGAAVGAAAGAAGLGAGAAAAYFATNRANANPAPTGNGTAPNPV